MVKTLIPATSCQSRRVCLMSRAPVPATGNSETVPLEPDLKDTGVASDQFQMFWFDGALSPIAQHCIRSFIRFPGVTLHLYSYDRNSDPKIPGCEWKDANDILSYDIADRYRRCMGSFSAASNLFRYQLLYQKGGWYFDTDCILVKPLNSLFSLQYVFGMEDFESVGAGVIKFPASHPLLKAMYDECIQIDPKEYRWSMAGPRMFTKYLARYGFLRIAFPPEFFYPIHYSAMELLQKPFRPFETTFIIHLWNEMLRRKKRSLKNLHPSVLEGGRELPQKELEASPSTLGALISRNGLQRIWARVRSRPLTK